MADDVDGTLTLATVLVCPSPAYLKKSVCEEHQSALSSDDNAIIPVQ